MDKKVIKLYLSGKTCQDIAKKLKISRNTVADILKDNNIIIKGRKGYHKYSFNERYFDCIGNEHQAYWLGWFFSDGYNQEKTNTVRLQVQKKDTKILKLLKKDIKYNGPIRETSNNQSLLFVTSYNFSHRLSYLGCIQNKSLVLTWPREICLPDKLVRHFIRGYFDGDGCISGKGNNYQLTILGTKQFCDKLNEYLSKIIGSKKLENHPTSSIKRYRISGRKQIQKIYNYMYNDSTISLDRKKQKMEVLLALT